MVIIKTQQILEKKMIFPNEIFLHIFTFVDKPSLSQVQQVCKLWYKLAQDHVAKMKIIDDLEQLFSSIFYKYLIGDLQIIKDEINNISQDTPDWTYLFQPLIDQIYPAIFYRDIAMLLQQRIKFMTGSNIERAKTRVSDYINNLANPIDTYSVVKIFKSSLTSDHLVIANALDKLIQKAEHGYSKFAENLNIMKNTLNGNLKELYNQYSYRDLLEFKYSELKNLTMGIYAHYLYRQTGNGIILKNNHIYNKYNANTATFNTGVSELLALICKFEEPGILIQIIDKINYNTESQKFSYMELAFQFVVEAYWYYKKNDSLEAKFVLAFKFLLDKNLVDPNCSDGVMSMDGFHEEFSLVGYALCFPNSAIIESLFTHKGLNITEEAQEKLCDTIEDTFRLEIADEIALYHKNHDQQLFEPKFNKFSLILQQVTKIIDIEMIKEKLVSGKLDAEVKQLMLNSLFKESLEVMNGPMSIS